MALFLQLGYYRQVDLPSLYQVVCQISYLGDFRFVLGGENPRKVDNIVEA